MEEAERGKTGKDWSAIAATEEHLDIQTGIISAPGATWTHRAVHTRALASKTYEEAAARTRGQPPLCEHAPDDEHPPTQLPEHLLCGVKESLSMARHIDGTPS